MIEIKKRKIQFEKIWALILSTICETISGSPASSQMGIVDNNK